ncbi:ATP-binding protein [Gymnodinialimonas sp. 2305UL16-5]|uniref:ATP-binding protein n=1 Tax=Gymnodinialimonas mytili TaxID=3126503 RepID=UPI00309EEB5A
MSDDLIQSVIEAVPDPMLHLGPSGEIARANTAATQMFGTWIVGRSHDAVIRQPGLLSRIEAMQAGEGASEGRFERSDQSGVTQFKVRLTSLVDTGLLLHFTDITHLREAEEMRRDFVANVSHELRTPLTAVLGFIETLRGPARNDPEAQARFLGIMEDEARRMNRLVSDLLSLSRVESEERVRPNEDVDLHAVLQGVIAALRPGAEDAGNSLVLECGDCLGDGTSRIWGDRDQVMQVFLNLCENAMKYGGPDKPVRIFMAREMGTGLLKGPVLRVDVTDEGEGIDSLHLPRLTERFYRIDTHRSREMGGTGLGLAIVKHIVNRHRGRLRITSEIGRGTTFSVQLPAI